MKLTSIALRARKTLALLQDYTLAALGNPKLLLRAIRHVLMRKSRALEGLLRADQISVPSKPVPRDWQDMVQELSGHMAVLVLQRQGCAGAIGVADLDLVSALAYLTAQVRVLEITVNGAPIANGSVALEHALLNARAINLLFLGPDGEAQQLQIEPYAPRGPGTWVSNNPANPVLRGVYADSFAQPGLQEAQTLLTGPSLADVARTRPIDVVYTWVNHADPAWAALYAQHKISLPGAVSRISDATALSRFHSNDELRYSLRSVFANLSWVNRIYVFTNCARPDWLSEHDTRLIWVQHEQVIPAQYLPTFSSHVIESFLHRIPDLAEHFLYINDDVFIAKPLDKSAFFAENGCSKAFLDPYGMVSGQATADDPDYLNAARNSAQLVLAELGFVPTQLHQHTVFALRKSVLDEIEAKWPAQLAQMRSHKFRAIHDLNIASFLYHHYAIGTGRALPCHSSTAFIKSLDIRWRHALMTTAETDLETFCINEGGSEGPAGDWHSTVRAFLERKYPQPAPWER